MWRMHLNRGFLNVTDVLKLTLIDFKGKVSFSEKQQSQFYDHFWWPKIKWGEDESGPQFISFEAW